MGQARNTPASLETQLGSLAMEFRGTRDEARRRAVTADYARVVGKLVASGKWREMPAIEDMLPDERMPRAFFEFWSLPVPLGK